MKADAPPQLTVIVVTYQSIDFVGAALRSVTAAVEGGGLSHELIVVDNASTDGTPDLIERAWPAARLIRNKQNVGFGTACNLAFSVANGATWLLLNPDALLDRDSLSPLLSVLAGDKRAAMAAPSIRPISASGGAESAGMLPGIRSFAGHFLFLNRILPGDRGGPWRGFQLRHIKAGKPRHVEWASGAVLLMRPSAVLSIRGFDESFFMYGEDLDLGRRLTQAGWHIWLVPESRATHVIAGSQQGVSTAWVDGIARAHALYANRLTRIATMILLVLGLALRTMAAAHLPHGELHRRRMRAALGKAMRLLNEMLRS